MAKIITLTVNPAIDTSTSALGIRPTSKLRCSSPLHHAGGGGINISRAINKLGGQSLCIYLAGGPTGKHLQMLLTAESLKQQCVPIEEWTRENVSVLDTFSKEQYRFVMPGPCVKKEEWQQLLELLESILDEGDYLVASGSLAPGIPSDFYAKVAHLCQRKKTKYILDSSGEPLLKGANAGVFLLKPNLLELSTLCGVKSVSSLDIERVAKTFLEKKTCEVLVVSMGANGAMLMTPDITEYIPAPTVEQNSTCGAGDSMVAGMAFSLLAGKSIIEMARYGVACGTAATINPGTQLCSKEDADTLYRWVNSHPRTDISNDYADKY